MPWSQKRNIAFAGFRDIRLRSTKQNSPRVIVVGIKNLCLSISGIPWAFASRHATTGTRSGYFARILLASVVRSSVDRASRKSAMVYAMDFSCFSCGTAIFFAAGTTFTFYSRGLQKIHAKGCRLTCGKIRVSVSPRQRSYWTNATACFCNKHKRPCKMLPHSLL